MASKKLVWEVDTAVKCINVFRGRVEHLLFPITVIEPDRVYFIDKGKDVPTWKVERHGW